MAGCSCGAPIRLALSQTEQLKVVTNIARTCILLKVPEVLTAEPDRRSTARSINQPMINGINRVCKKNVCGPSQ
jgi:hypothetical protein